MKVSIRGGGDPPLPKDPPNCVFFALFFFFFVHIESKLRKHKRKSIFTWHFSEIVQTKIAKDTGHLCFFWTKFRAKKVVKKLPRFPFRDWRVHRKYHIKVLHFGTLSIHFSISKWEAWWTFATFVPNNRVYFARKSWSKSHHASHFETFSVPQIWHLFDTNLFNTEWFAMCRSFFS